MRKENWKSFGKFKGMSDMSVSVFEGLDTNMVMKKREKRKIKT